MVTHDNAQPPPPELPADASLLGLSVVATIAQRLTHQALQPELDLHLLLEAVLTEMQALVPFDVGWLFLQEGEWLRVRATDPGHRSDVGISFALDDCMSGLGVTRREVINIPDLAALPAALRRIYKAPRSMPQAMRSELVLPLLVGSAAIGAISIESAQPGAFGLRDIEVLRLLCNHVALTVELVRSRQEAGALSAISLQLARETEVNAVVRTVLDRSLALIESHFGQLLLTEGADLVVRYTTNVPPRDLGLRFRTDHCVSGLAVQARRPVIVPDVTQPEYLVVELPPAPTGGGPRLLPHVAPSPPYQRVLEREKERIQAELAVPIWSGGTITGVLNVETPREDGFTEAQRRSLAGFARAAGERYAAALAAADAPDAPDGGDALRSLLDEGLALVDTAFGQLLHLDGEELVIVCTTGGEPEGTRVPVARSVSGRAVSTRGEVYVPDVEREPLYRRYLGEEMKSELAVPLVSGERVIGVLNLESPAPAFFTSEHARILQALAGQAAVAIERAQRTEIERLAAIGGLAGDLVHRLNNPIGALSGWLDMLQRKPFYAELAAAYPYVGQFVSRAQRDIARAKAIIQELRTELRSHTPQPVVLQAAVANALARSHLAAGHGEADAPEGRAAIQVNLDLPPGPLHVLAGPGLSGVFWNLFDNAAKAMPEGGVLTVTAAKDEPGWVTIEVADTGVGIEPWRLPNLFEAGETTTVDRYAPAHGLGLWWTRGQVESFGGTIRVVSRPAAGTRFIIRLRAG
jgi:signal transduction histidine kinase